MGFETVDDYVGSLPAGTRTAFDQARQAIRTALPGAQEAVSYQILGFRLDGRTVVHLAGWQRHISIYPVPDVSDDPSLGERLAPYLSGRSTAKFPLRQPIPLDLIGELARRLARA